MVVIQRFAVMARLSIFFLVIFSCELAQAKACVVPKGPSAHEYAHFLVNHVQVMGDLKGFFFKKKILKAVPTAKTAPAAKVATKKVKQITQTEAYLSVPSCATLADTHWSSDRKRLKSLVDKVMAREREHNDDYYVFYHGQMRQFCVLQDFLKEFYQLLNVSKPFDDFAFLRAWYDGVSDPSVMSLQDFIDDYEKAKGTGYGYYGTSAHPDWNDHEDYLRRVLLPVNISLFGNAGSPGECTFDFFLHSWNIGFSDISHLIQGMLDKCGIDSSYVARLNTLAGSLTSSEGVLMQVFIPKKYVDRCVYLCHPMATPYRTPILDSSFDIAKERHTNISSILELYKKHPDQIADINGLQARIVFYPGDMLNPERGIKIFRYMTVSDSDMATYSKKVKALVQEALVKLLMQKISAKKKSLDDLELYKGTSLEKLLKKFCRDVKIA